MFKLFKSKSELRGGQEITKPTKPIKQEEESAADLETQEDPEVAKNAIANVLEYYKKIIEIGGNFDVAQIEQIAGMPLNKFIEALEKNPVKIELSSKELLESLKNIMTQSEKPNILTWIRNKFTTSVTGKAVFVALMLFLKFAPDLQAMEKRSEIADEVGDKTEMVKENQELDDGKTYEANVEDFNKAELSVSEFIDSNIDDIKDIIEGEKYEAVIDNPYLLSSLYYSQKFLKNISNEVNQKNMATKIIGPIVEDLSPEFKLGVIDHFKNLSQKLEIEKGIELSKLEVTPLESLDFGHGIGHNDALDLYIAEGSNISAMQDGLVVLAETGWNPENEASTSSYLGGNTVITYNYKTNEFVRYAHLDEVNVKPGDIIKAGDDLGTVGNSGMNAYKPGHGNHLHLEINKVNEDGSNQFVYNKQLQERINNTRVVANR